MPIHTAAAAFHELSREFLDGVQFELVNDPTELLSPYFATRAVYKNPRGFYLWFGFDPLDAGAAYVTCGRRWTANGRDFGLSCKYSSLANRFGFDVPERYPIRSDDGLRSVSTEILTVLQQTLPVILAKVTLDDVIKCEEGPFTARRRAEGALGADYLRIAEISEFS